MEPTQSHSGHRLSEPATPLPPSWLEPQPTAELGLSGATLPGPGRSQQAQQHHPATYCSCSSKSCPLGTPVPFRFSRRQGASSAVARETRVSLHGPLVVCDAHACRAALSSPPPPPGEPLPSPARLAGGQHSPRAAPDRSEGTESGVPLCSWTHALRSASLLAVGPAPCSRLCL